MRYRRPLRRRSAYVYSSGFAAAPRQRRGLPLALLFILAILCLFLAAVAVFLKDLSSQIAVSDASDIVTVQVNNAIADIMAEQDYSGDYFVSFENSASSAAMASLPSRILRL